MGFAERLRWDMGALGVCTLAPPRAPGHSLI
jgi:hypothetical protein